MRTDVSTYASLVLAVITVLAFVSSGASAQAPTVSEMMDSGSDAPARWAVDKNHSRIGFKVRHLGIANVRGDFQEYEVTMDFDPEDLRTLSVQTSISAASIDTGVDRRDNDLRSDRFFNAEQFPTVTFVSKEVRNIDGGVFELVGDLTMLDVTKEVVMEAEYLGTVESRGRRKAGFTAETTVNRFDYNLTWGDLTETGGLVAGKDVRIDIELEMAEVVPEP